VHPLGAAALVGSALCWATGTVASRRSLLPESAVLSSGMQMLGGGAVLAVLAVLTGEIGPALAADVGAYATISFLWLLVAGSLVGFTIYLWLLRESTPAVASTYAFVNPVVAVLLGWWWAGEPLGPGCSCRAG
jgi:drug/metabolite transporter (DMT)-like permease